jgi:hypothetical protein
MFIDLINSKSAENFDLVKEKVEEMQSIFAKVSLPSKVNKKSFMQFAHFLSIRKQISEALIFLIKMLGRLLLRELMSLKRFLFIMRKI